MAGIYIPDIPLGWKPVKTKYIADLYTGNSISDNEKDDYTDPVNAHPYIATKHVDVDLNTIDYDNGLYVKNNDDRFRVAFAGSALMCIEGGSAGRKKAFLDRNVAFVNKLCCFKPKEHAIGKYLYYCLMSPLYEDDFKMRITGLIGGVSVSELRDMILYLPSLSEQQAIADYLDERCSKIDEIIAEATSSIEEYKELKQAVIFEAVTKGLDKNVPMKDSGDNWIGKIPCSWYKCRLSDVSTRIIVGLATSTTPYYRDTGVVMFRNLNIKDGWLDDSELLFLDDEFASKQAGKYINAGDVLTVHTGSNLGLSCVVPDKYDHTLSFTTLITSPDKNLIISEFLAYIINSPLGKREIEKLKVGEIKPNLNVRQFKYFTVIVPPLETQKDIVRYLDNKCELINELISEKQSLVDDLQAYKKSLIYEVVTGKRRVV